MPEYFGVKRTLEILFHIGFAAKLSKRQNRFKTTREIFKFAVGKWKNSMNLVFNAELQFDAEILFAVKLRLKVKKLKTEIFKLAVK